MRHCKWVRTIAMVLLISFFAEMLFSNYSIISSLRNPHNIKVNECHFYIDENGKANIDIDDIEFMVKNISIIYEQSTKELVRYTVFVDQYGQEGAETEYPEKWDLMKRNTRICTNCVTKVHSLRIKGDFSETNIREVVLNSTIIKFNFIRFFLLFMISLCIVYRKKLLECEFSMKRCTIVLAAIINILMIGFAFSEMRDDFRIMDSPEGQDMNLVVEALAVGQVSFVGLPAEELINMENPYDYTLRTKYGVPYLFDATYYEGKFYTYFGVAPVLVIMLPFHLLTGKYLHTYVVNLFFMILFVFVISALYYLVVKRYAHKITEGSYILGYLVVLIGSGFFTLLRGQKYDLAVTCALFFVGVSILLMYSLLVESRWEKIKLFTGGGGNWTNCIVKT